MPGENAYIIRNGGPCNNRCVTCAKRPESGLSLEKIVKELDRAKADGFDEVFFADRELMLRKDKGEILKAIAARGLRFGLSTNGRVFIHERIVMNLKRFGLKRVEVTLHAGSPYPHFLVTREEGFHQTVDGIGKIIEAGLEVEIVIPVNAYNRGSLKSAVLVAESMPKAPPLRFEPHPELDFSSEMEEAIEYRRLLRGETFESAITAARFKSLGEEVELDLKLCPYKRGKTLVDEPERHLLLRREPGRYVLHRLEGDIPLFKAFITKSVRNLVFIYDGGARRRVRLETACHDCRVLAHCHACFYVDDEEENGRGGEVEAEGLSTDADAVADLSSGEAAEAMKALREAMRGLRKGEKLLVKGVFPIALIGESGPEEKTVNDPGIGLIADMAAIHSLKIVDYALPQHTGREDFRILYENTGRIVSKSSERAAVFAVSSACVADCVMCSMPKTYGGRAIPTPMTLPVLEEIKLCGFTAVDSFGGEITLRDDLPALIRFVKSLNLYAMIITTGYAVDDAFVAELVEAGLDKIEVALDAPTAELHDRIKGRKGLFEHAVRAVKAAHDNGKLYVEVNTVILRDNVYELPELHRFVADELGCRRQRMFYFIQIPSALTHPRWLTAGQSRDFFEEIRPELLRLSGEMKTKIDFCPPIDPGDFGDIDELVERMSSGRYQEPGRCRAPERDLMIMPDGEVYGCMSPMVIHTRTPVGKLADKRIIDCLNGEMMALWLREAGTWRECLSCISKR